MEQNIIEYVCSEYGATLEEIQGKSRNTYIREARQVLQYLLYTSKTATLERTGEITKRDHSTVHHSIKVVENERQTNKRINKIITKYESTNN